MDLGVNMSEFNLENLDNILKETVKSISQGKSQMRDIAENARKECVYIEKEYQNVKEELEKVFQNIKDYEINLKKCKQNLMKINKNYNEYSQEEMRNIYLETDKYRVDLALENQREQMLINMRNDLEKRLKNAKLTLEKAENLVNHVGVAMDFLSGNLDNLSTHLEGMNNKNRLAIKVLESQEQDRKKIAREIHDGIAQTMSNVVLKAELCNKLCDIDNQRTKDELNNLKLLTRGALEEVRGIIYDLRPMSLDDLGIVSTLDRYIKKFSEENNFVIEYNVKGHVVELDNVIRIALFRVTQEALNNVVKHSQAKLVQINLNFSKEYVELFIKDDGKGFDMNNVKVTENSGYGICGMEERISLLNGKFIIKSQIGKGTMCMVRVKIS
jgi:two-component system sensor histidine kinase DegS